MKISFVFASLLAGMALSSAGVSAADTENANIEKEILVPGSRLQQTTFELPASVSVITAEQIATSPAQTVADLLASEAGINVRSLYGNHAVRATVDLRGFGVTGGQNTLILLDGRRLNDVDLASVNFAALPLHNIERIEIVRGAGGVLYGDGASGAINIVTRRSQQQELSGLIGVSGGSFDTRTVEGRLGYGTGKAAINLAADSIDSDGYRDNNELTQRNVQLEGRIDTGFADFYTKAGYSDQDLRLPGVRTVSPTQNIDELRRDPKGTTTPRDYAEEQAGFITVGFSRQLGDNAGMLIDAGYRDRKQEAFFDDYAFGGAFANFVDTTLRSVSVTPRVYIDHALFGDDGRLTAGIDYYDHTYDSDRSLNAQTRGRPIHRLAVDQRNVAGYLQDLSHLNSRTTLNLGVRLQRVRLEAQDNFDSAAPGGAFDSGAPAFSESDSEYMAEAGLRYAFTDAAGLFVRAGRSVRFGTVDDLYEFGSSFTREFSPLEPQTARHVDLGVDFASGPLKANLTAYVMNLEHEIHYNPASFANENLDPTRRSGLEASFSVQAHEKLALRANYTALKATFRDGPFDGNNVPVVPRRLANLSAVWSLLPNAELAATWRYVGKKVFDNDQSATFGSDIPAYDVLDAKLSVTHRQWKLSVTAANLLDEDAFDYGVASLSMPGRFNAYPLPERSFLLGVRREF